jgi:allantoin racemase
MRILLVNSNTSAFVTDKVAQAARVIASPGTEIVPVTGNFGARIIATRTELAIAGHATIDLLAQHAPGCDAVVIAVSYDVALQAAREMLDIPVVGITEAALLTACMLGGRIGMVVWGQRVLPIYQEVVAAHGFSSRIAGWRAVESNAPYSAGDQSAADALAIAAANQLVEQDGAEVIVLTGAVMAGVPERLQAMIGVPVLDGVNCAVRQAELLARLRPVSPRTGSYAPPGPRETAGLSPALQTFFTPRT